MKASGLGSNPTTNISDNPIIKFDLTERIKLINLILLAASKENFPSKGSPEEKKNSFEEFQSLLLPNSKLREPFLKLFSPSTNANGMKTIHSISQTMLAKYLEAVIDYSLIQNKDPIIAEISKLKRKNTNTDLELMGEDQPTEVKTTNRRIASHSDINNLNEKIKTQGFNFHTKQADSPFHHSLINDKNKVYAILNQDGLNKVKGILDILLTKVKSASKNLNPREQEFLSAFETQSTREVYHKIFRQTALGAAVFMPKLKILLGLAT